MTTVLDGKAASQEEILKLQARVQALSGPVPKLVVILVGDNPASQVYVNRKAKVAREIGMASEVITLAANTSQELLQAEIQRLNADASVHGILIQLPLPKHLDALSILAEVDPRKDVDCFHPENLGRLLSGEMPTALPCTPAGMMTLLDHYNIPLAGKHAVVVGRSNIVGKPMALLLLQRDATVTICHSRTQDLAALTRQADILVAAVGIPHCLKAGDIKPGAVVLDVGINRLADGRLVGDVDYDAVFPHVSAITPVPGGVGPMTIATLMANTLALYEQSQRVRE